MGALRSWDDQNAPVAFVDAHGIRIETHEWLVPAPRAIVQVSHGIGEHAGRYAALAADLNAADFSVVADDHRGHGRTGEGQWGGDPARTCRRVTPVSRRVKAL